MSIFDELEKLYSEIDSFFAAKEFVAYSKGHFKEEAKCSNKRQLNDQSYFLFMFSRFEDRVREMSNKLIDNKIANLSDWNIKRTWEIINKQKNRDALHFMDRVSLLTTKGQADYNLINQYFEQRNKIAHGGNFTIAINIPTVFADMKRLYYALKIYSK